MKPIVLSMGDAAGIGPEIILKGLDQAPQEAPGCVVYGDMAVMRRAQSLLGLQGLRLAEVSDLAQLAALPASCLGVIQACELPAPPPWGRISAEAGRAAAQCVSAAARAVLNGQAAALVTAPLNKEALSAAGLPWSAYPGHTELLQAQAAEHLGRRVEELPVRMMLVSPQLRTVLVSIHLPLRQALDLLSTEGILTTLEVADAALRPLLGRAPILAVAGVNPHAGEGGLFGTEETEIIAPAVSRAQQAGMQVSGPHAPDTVFMQAREGRFDAVVAMYHDQGLIPVKYLGLAHGVNVTLGLPLLRTSPDHGTAFDLAGTGRADASSWLAALRLARSSIAS